MHSLMQVPVKSAVFGRFCFAHAYRDRSETYRQRNINSKHTVHAGAADVLHEYRLICRALHKVGRSLINSLNNSLDFFGDVIARTQPLLCFFAQYPSAMDGLVILRTFL